MKLKELMDQEGLHLNHLAELIEQSIKEEKLLSARLMELE
jgi:hypothetical protein